VDLLLAAVVVIPMVTLAPVAVVQVVLRELTELPIQEAVLVVTVQHPVVLV
jgi:hypothetical protein